MIFIDGDDEEQVDYALKRAKTDIVRHKIILVRGNIIDLMTKFKLRMYFDQKGILSKHFSLENFPTVISRDGDELKIEEIRI